VIEAHGGVRLGTHDVYLNVAGGMKISEPAADLAVAAALVSSLTNTALPPKRVYFGELSLSGAIRPVSHAGSRLKEAVKLGFESAVAPNTLGKSDGSDGILPNIRRVSRIAELTAEIAEASLPQRHINHTKPT
jgi:DNA repair protein RadA/Sms